MPKQFDRADLDWSLVGENIRWWRHATSVTQSELTSRAGLTAMTIYNAEKGRPVSTRTLKKIASALEIPVSELCLDQRVAQNRDQGYFLHRAETTVWWPLGVKRQPGRPEPIYSEIDAPERRRVALLGFVAGFVHTTQFVMPEGPGMNSIELFGRFEGQINQTLYKDALLLCLEGEVTATIKGAGVLLKTGDTIGFSTKHLTSLEPSSHLTPNALPVRLLWIGGNRLGKVPGGSPRKRVTDRSGKRAPKQKASTA